MSSSRVSKFDNLPTRPPTPPRELTNAVDDAINFLDDGNEVDRLITKSRPDPKCVDSAPEATPSSSQESTGLSNPTKRVGFSPHPHYHKISTLNQLSPPSAKLRKRSPSAAHAKPLKSILKFSNAPPPTPEDLDSKLTYFSPDVPGSFAKMLQSVIPQLAGPSRSLRLDAYLALNGALREYENIPDPTAMAQKMGVFMQFLSRDIAWKDSSGISDGQIVSQALKLIIAILFNPTLSNALDDDFKSFLIERSIAALEQPEMPKQIIKTHMYLLAQQRLRSSTMASGKADKIVTALHTIENRCSGNSVVASRLVIYTRLLEQAPSVMLSRIREWLEHVFHGMLSSIKDIRGRAIDACTQAGLSLGQQTLASKALHEMFSTDVEEGQTYCDYLIARLLQMTSDKETGAYVPQIWAAVILFFRSKRKPLEQWPNFKTWRLIIQRCFNSSDLTTRYQAMLAWNKLVFATMPDFSTSKSTKTTLRQLICTNMDKRGTDKFSKQVRQFALHSYYNLLHYGLRPGLSNEELDDAWDAFVDPVLRTMVKSNTKGRNLTCQILHGFFSGNTGVWNVNAALESTPIKPEELPRLDPRWVRSRLMKILELLEPAISVSMWNSSDANATLDATWLSLMQSLADAGSQEVKTTPDLKEAIALLVSFFRRLWHDCTKPPEGNYDHGWLSRYVSLLDTVLVILGTSPFAEDILATTKEDIIEVAATPSHRPSKRQSTPQSPSVILFGQFFHPPSAINADETYKASALALLERLLSCKLTPAATLELLNKSSRAWMRHASFSVQLSVRAHAWDVIAEVAMQRLASEVALPNKQDSQNLGHTLRNGVDILSKGLGDYSMPADLYDALFDAAKTGAGDGGVVLAVMEPFAQALNADTSSPFKTKLRLATHMLARKVWPKTRQSLDQARKALWGVGLITQKPAIFDPFDCVYSLVVGLLSEAYNTFDDADESDSDTINSLVTSALDFLEASPLSLLATALRKTQNGFAMWVEDTARKTSGSDRVSALVPSAWSRYIRLLELLPSKDSPVIKALEPIMVAGFTSPHRTIVNKTIVFWNSSFGEQQSLEYPERLEAVLRARLSDADLTLPSFPESNGEQMPVSLPDFFDSQSQAPSEYEGRKLLDVPRTAEQGGFLAAKRSPVGGESSASSPARRVSRRSGSSTPKVRLRHNDSQIQFAPIDSSPLLPADDSQLMTEHQKEVKARQVQNAQLFPDFSSSPMAQSTALPRSLSKRLDFVSEANQESDNEGFGTPTGLPDANGLISDDMPSSPTPSSSKDAGQAAFEMDDDQEDGNVPVDPPSSPPRAQDEADVAMDEQHAADQDDTTVDVADFSITEVKGVLADNVQEEAPNAVENSNVHEPETDEMISATEYPSDSQLPTVQLQLEEEAAQQSTGGRAKLQREDAEEIQQPPVHTQLQDAQPHQNDVEAGLVQNSFNRGNIAETEQDDVTRVEDSFIVAGAMNAEVDIQSNGDSQSPKASKKRKRRSSTNFTTKKRKQQSPLLRRVWSKIVGGEQDDDDDDDIEDEIVVASSQIPSSPDPIQLDPALEGSSVPAGMEDESVVVVKEEQDTMQPPPKRGRGRPRKSETPVPSQAEEEAPRALKRKASTLSNASLSESQASTSFVKDTPAPTKAKKTPPGSPDAGRVRRRKATAVVVGTPSYKAIPSQQDDGARATSQPSADGKEGGSTQVATPEDQLVGEHADAVNDRPILTPRSILGRLRDALSGMRGMILGSQEEREFDDVLFELRRETHEAGRRGRA